MLAKAKSTDTVVAAVQKGQGLSDGIRGGGRFKVECLDKDGNLKWTAESQNLVVNVGLQDMNTQYFKGVSYSAAWYIGLITGPAASTTISAGDTMSSHGATGAGGWTENTGYSNANRPTATFGTATTADPSVIDNSASPASFSINATSTIAGAFLVNNNTKGGTTGTLFSAADFQSPGDRSVVSGDTLNVTYTFSLDAL
jgi:hypothetical protein